MGSENRVRIRKALKGLQDLEISLDILAETGVGKTVNSFRRHGTVGNLAKSLISQWKKIPPNNARESPKRKSNVKKVTLSSKENKHSEKSQASGSSCKTSFSSDKRKEAHCLKNQQMYEGSGSLNRHRNEEQSNDICKNSPGEQKMDSSIHICKESNEKQKSAGTWPAMAKGSEKSHSSTVNKKDDLSFKEEKSSKNLSTKQMGTESKGTLKPNSRSKSPVKSTSGGDFEPPTMSFESYLNYDQASCRRKRRASTSRRVTTAINSSASQKSVTAATDDKEETLKLNDCSEMPSKKAKMSLQDLLNTPLPKVLPEMLILSPPHAAEFKAPPAMEIPRQRSETAPFTGRRLNSKMQVYSGSKIMYLPKMLTLYEQCIRVLQNNIDSLHEVGGVPFEILEPVFTRCTPEQLFRIEDCNPTFVEESDHLWKKHCQKDFRNERLLEYESWREMYLRLFSQREEKLKSLTKSIVSAQSEKPKGRQVKMAFVHGMAKPPRNIRRQQEIYGTAGPVQLQPE
ncbi:elongin-A-like [Tiliqua scincoides]|uniref:elongin-A-like n=1 Tax=Tiliqua scincoides TaxID=71010 RepID=UPI003461E206